MKISGRQWDRRKCPFWRGVLISEVGVVLGVGRCPQFSGGLIEEVQELIEAVMLFTHTIHA